METLYDYVKWMEDFDFGIVPLRDADILVMCLIVYFDLTPVFSEAVTEDSPTLGMAEPETGGDPASPSVAAGDETTGPETEGDPAEEAVYVRDMIPLVDRGEEKLLITGGDMGNREVFEAAVHSKRFGSLRMTDCVDIFQEEPPLQFAAVTFRCDQFILIAYRGTDSSLASWKENFMISFKRTRAQELAAAYANKIVAGADRPCYIAGHSKGGNLATYAGCCLTETNLEKTTHIYTLDGPGLCPEVVNPVLIKRIDSKTTFINPVFDVIGKLYELPFTNVKFIYSSHDGFAQHSLPSWLVDHGKLALAPGNSHMSIRLNQALSAWVEDKPPEIREIFVDELFEAIEEKGVKDFETMKFETLIEILISLRSASDTTREVLKDLQQKLLKPEGHFQPSFDLVRLDLNELKNDFERHVANLRKKK